MKKKLLLTAAIAICFAIVASGTVAYFASEDTAHNIITTGGVSIEVVEKMQDANGTFVDFPDEGIKGVVPGADVSKIVSVENIGESEAWIRVQVEAAIKAEDGSALPLELEDSAPVMTYTAGDRWTLSADGYYYYDKPVAAGKSTDILFDTVSFSAQMGNEYQNCTANIVISAQAVQTANNGNTVQEAQGWPEA